MLKDASIVSSRVIDNEICEDVFEMPAPKSKEEKIRRELYRRECLLKALNVS